MDSDLVTQAGHSDRASARRHAHPEPAGLALAPDGGGRGSPGQSCAAGQPWSHLRLACTVGLVALVLQIFLGGWTSTNYAALACNDFPTCQQQWWPDADYDHAFHLTRELGQSPDGDALGLPALTAIHFTHRLGAIAVTVILLWLIVAAWRERELRGLATMLFAALVLQIGLGISNVLFSLPLSVAVAHNGGAAVLLAVLVMLKLRVWRG